MAETSQAIVVIGASAGGVQALMHLVGELPADSPATIFVVMHIGATPSRLPAVLSRVGPLPASHAVDGEAFRPGHIYVAQPDHHLLVGATSLQLSRGPRENHFRPAIDPLFRSAAQAHGPRTVGVILSGALDDGVEGLMMIKARGGMVVVQQPEEAIFDALPASALRHVAADHVLPAREIGRLLGQTRPWRFAESEVRMMDEPQASAEAIIHEDFGEQVAGQRNGELTMFTCPDCGGALWQTDSGPVTRFRCHVGHTFAPEGLIGLKSEEVEAALWSSVRMLRERATLTRQVARQLRLAHQAGGRAESLDDKAALDERRAEVILDLLRAPIVAVDDPGA